MCVLMGLHFVINSVFGSEVYPKNRVCITFIWRTYRDNFYIKLLLPDYVMGWKQLKKSEMLSPRDFTRRRTSSPPQLCDENDLHRWWSSLSETTTTSDDHFITRIAVCLRRSAPFSSLLGWKHAVCLWRSILLGTFCCSRKRTKQYTMTYNFYV